MSIFNKEQLETSDLIAIIAIFVSILSLVITIIVSIYLSNKTNRLTATISSEEYEMTESMKSDLTEIVSLLKTIENEAFLISYIGGSADFSMELQALKNIQTRPGYRVFLYLIDDHLEKIKVENGMLLLTEKLLVSDDTPIIIIRAWVHEILKTVVTHVDFNRQIDYVELLKETASADELLKETDVKKLYIDSKNVVKDFLSGLEREGIDSLEIIRIDSVFNTSDMHNREIDSAFWENYLWKTRSLIEPLYEYMVSIFDHENCTKP